MRYLNWDVLLFPGSSRVPIQEFDTKCHAVHNPNDRWADNIALSGFPQPTSFDYVSQCPILTSFISSLEQGAAFRVSVHSWEPPKPSQVLSTFKRQDEAVAYEARVYIDGEMVAQRVFGSQAAWPEVIERTGNADNSHAKPMRFPAFHAEILDQSHWDAGETFGRIRVALAEGVIRHEAPCSPTFDRLRDSVIFSFQHAPKHILEYSSIAWPNANMFRADAEAFQSYIAGRIGPVPDFQAHAHSPQRHHGQALLTGSIETNSTGFRTNRPLANQPTHLDDPFIGPVPILQRSRQALLRAGSSDAFSLGCIPMGTTRSFSGTEMSGVSYQKVNFGKHMTEANVGEILEALSPEKKFDLFKALSPGQDSSGKDNIHSEGENCEDSSAGVPMHATTDSPLANIHRSADGHHVSPLRGNLLSSKYALPSTSIARKAKFHNDSRSSFSSSGKNVMRTLSTKIPDTIKSQASFRPRSNSSSSKRKWRDSPDKSTPKDLSKALHMSTSPCEQNSSTPTGSGKMRMEGGVFVGKQE